MIYYILGLILIVIGCFHLLGVADRVEPEIVLYVQNKFKNNPLLVFFKEIWFFGRTSFALIMLLFLTCFGWKMGSVASGVFFVAVGIEHFVKKLSNRERPYISHPAIAMLQPLEPTDSSFPSGDSLRIWYLALIVPAALGDSTLFLTTAISLAVLVTLGRIVMGVHYFTDTLAGAGLGILSAGTTIWFWTQMNIF
ncbi:MAG: hypothetical protein DRI65_08895 [Chloroflexota bacterium]|nr:MAG: hypothetical protein DRI65_08895 [Chloroflexota bacterium]HDD61608.1 phosphatase PAP2 family protein [Chloroflexota bacterium]